MQHLAAARQQHSRMKSLAVFHAALDCLHASHAAFCLTAMQQQAGMLLHIAPIWFDELQEITPPAKAVLSEFARGR